MATGVTFLNTADFYGAGQSESVISKAIRGRRDQAFVSVKFGMMTEPSGKGLGIDLYVPGHPDERVPYEDAGRQSRLQP